MNVLYWKKLIEKMIRRYPIKKTKQTYSQEWYDQQLKWHEQSIMWHKKSIIWHEQQLKPKTKGRTLLYLSALTLFGGIVYYNNKKIFRRLSYKF